MTETGSLSTADLIRQAEEQLSTLIRDEVRLAKAEVAAKARVAGYGAGLFAGAALAAFFALAAVLVAIGLALAYAVPGWVAALIVAAALAVTAAVTALVGKKKLGQGLPPTPERAISSIRTDIETMGTAVKEREADDRV